MIEDVIWKILMNNNDMLKSFLFYLKNNLFLINFVSGEAINDFRK